MSEPRRASEKAGPLPPRDPGQPTSAGHSIRSLAPFPPLLPDLEAELADGPTAPVVRAKPEPDAGPAGSFGLEEASPAPFTHRPADPALGAPAPSPVAPLVPLPPALEEWASSANPGDPVPDGIEGARLSDVPPAGALASGPQTEPGEAAPPPERARREPAVMVYGAVALGSAVLMGAATYLGRELVLGPEATIGAPLAAAVTSPAAASDAGLTDELATAEAGLRRSIRELEATRDGLAAEVAEAKEQAQREAAERRAASARHDDLLAHSDDLSQQVAALEAERATAEATLGQLRGDAQHRGGELDRLAEARTALDQEVQGQHTQLEERRGELGALEQQRAALAAQVSTLQDAVARQESELASLRQRRGALETEIGNLDDRAGQRRRDLVQLDERQSRLERRLAELEAAVRARSPAPRAEGEVVATGTAHALVAAADEPPPTAPAVTPDGAVRVFVHYAVRDTAAMEQARAAAAALAGQRVTVADIRAVPYGVSINRIRYFHPEDARPSEAVGQTVRAALGGAGTTSPVHIQDFTSFRPSPAAGTIEVWVAGG